MCSAFILLSTSGKAGGRGKARGGGGCGGDPVSGNISHRTLWLNRAGHFQLSSPCPGLVSDNNSGRAYQSDRLAIYDISESVKRSGVCVCTHALSSLKCVQHSHHARPSCSQGSCLAARGNIAPKRCVKNQHAGFWTILSRGMTLNLSIEESR